MMASTKVKLPKYGAYIVAGPIFGELETSGVYYILICAKVCMFVYICSKFTMIYEYVRSQLINPIASKFHAISEPRYEITHSLELIAVLEKLSMEAFFMVVKLHNRS